jgi:hypothetical protein
MPGKSIFIASSYEAKELAKRIADCLGQTGNLLPVPWWDAFTLGGYTFDELNRQSRSVDAAIFLATKDDKVWYRQKEGDRPRDNVIFEYGLFANRLGLHRSIMVVEDGVLLPSDVLGVTYQRLDKECVEATAQSLADHFQREFEQENINDVRSSLRVICHPQLPTLQVSSNLPQDWLMRAMYLGTEGARAWLSIVTDPNYETDVERAAIADAIIRMLNQEGSNFRTYISLGPGDAQLDDAVALTLLESEPTAQCIPVDLSDGLLWSAVYSLSDSIRIPIGVLADFEENFKFVTQQAREYSKGPYLYGLFGNTFGNLDKTELNFVKQLAAYMGPHDKIMLDVTTVKDAAMDIAPGPVDVRSWTEGTKRFFAHGAARTLRISDAEAYDQFANLVTVNGALLQKPIAGTQLLTVRAKGKPFARVRRYRFDALKEYFKAAGFKVDSELIPSDGPFDIGLIALRKK